MQNKSLNEQIVDMYENGDSIESISKALKITRRITQYHLINAGFITGEIPDDAMYYFQFCEKWNKAVSRLRGIPGLDKIKLSAMKRSEI